MILSARDCQYHNKGLCLKPGGKICSPGREGCLLDRLGGPAQPVEEKAASTPAAPPARPLNDG